jgi:hypothetical protein
MNGELFFDGKKYISSKRAAQISGYANDYIGQLCRGEKLESRMIGRSWYVSLDSLVSYKKFAQNETLQIKKRNGQPLLRKGETKQEVVGIQIAGSHIKPAPTIGNVSQEKLSIISSVINYEPDNSPLLPSLGNKQQKVSPVVSGKKLVTKSHAQEETETQTVPVAISSEYKKEDKKLNPRISAVAIDSHIQIKPKPSFAINKKIAFAFAAVVIIFGSLFINFQLKSTSSILSEKAPATRLLAQSEKSASNSFLGFVNKSIRDLAVSFYETINDLTTESFSTLVFQDDKDSDYDQTQKSKEIANLSVPIPVSKGIVVVPASDEKIETEKIIQEVKNSFSDEVVVKPDSSGVSGVIQPMFREASGDEYIYVLVPVNN